MIRYLLKFKPVDVPYKLPTTLLVIDSLASLLTDRGMKALSEAVVDLVINTGKKYEVQEMDDAEMFGVCNTETRNIGNRKGDMILSLYYDAFWCVGKSKVMIPETYVLFPKDEMPDVVLTKILKID